MPASNVQSLSLAQLYRRLRRLRAVARPSIANLGKRADLLNEIERRTGRWESY